MAIAPDPHAMSGFYDTSETGGAGNKQARIEGVSTVFDRAKAADLAYALRSMDEEDEEVPGNLVQTSPGLTVNRGDPDGDRRRVTAAAARAADNLHAAGMDVDPASGAVTARDHSQPWVNHARSIGPMVQVEEKTDRSAG